MKKHTFLLIYNHTGQDAESIKLGLPNQSILNAIHYTLPFYDLFTAINTH